MIWAIILVSIATIAVIWYLTGRDLAQDRYRSELARIDTETRAEIVRIEAATVEPPSDEAMRAMTERTKKPWRP